MARQLKRWESPRREGRNDKGKGGAARQRQRQKQLKNLVKKLKEQNDRPNPDQNPSYNPNKTYKPQEGREHTVSSLFAYEQGRCKKVNVWNDFKNSDSSTLFFALPSQSADRWQLSIVLERQEPRRVVLLLPPCVTFAA